MNRYRLARGMHAVMCRALVLALALLFGTSPTASDAYRGAGSSTADAAGASPRTDAPALTIYLPSILRSTPQWILVWSDEFDGTGSVNPSNWLCDVGTGYPGGPAHWGTGEVEVMTCSVDNSFQSGGYLNVRALHAGSDPVTGWTSARLETARTDLQPVGNGAMAVEARIKLPDVTGAPAQGYWPAFWMLGAPFRGNYWNWPGIGEIDILENINGLNQWWGTLHCGSYPGGPCGEPTGIGGTWSSFSPALHSEFHLYRVELDRGASPQALRWYVDGVQRFTVNSSQVDAATWDAATNHGFFIILDLAIGGAWAGAPTASTASGGTMHVDYVRVYLWN